MLEVTEQSLLRRREARQAPEYHAAWNSRWFWAKEVLQSRRGCRPLRTGIMQVPEGTWWGPPDHTSPFYHVCLDFLCYKLSPLSSSQMYSSDFLFITIKPCSSFQVFLNISIFNRASLVFIILLDLLPLKPPDPFLHVSHLYKLHDIGIQYFVSFYYSLIH